MSEILSNIVVQQIEATFQPEVSNLNITPNAISLNIYTSAAPIAAGSNTDVQFNLNGALFGSNAFTFNNSTNTVTVDNFVASDSANLGDASNVTILGGTNGYFLQTDGTGNLTWAAGGNGGGGNGTPGGSNTQIQYNDAGVFGGNAGFTFNEVTGNVAIPGNLSVVGTINANIANSNYANFAGNVVNSSQPNITSVGTLTSLSVTGTMSAGNVTGNGAGLSSLTGANVSGQVGNSLIAGTVYTNAQPNITSVGTLTGITVNGITSLGSISNVQITGGSNNQVLTTNGSGNLSWSSVSSGSWANAASIPIGGICFGRVYGLSVTPTDAGNIFSSNANIQWASFIAIAPAVTGNVAELNNIDGLLWCASYSSNVVGYSSTGLGWTNITTPLKPFTAPVKGSNNIVIFASSSNKAAYSNNLGNTWSNVTLPNSGTWQDIAYGSNTFVICTSQASYNKVAYSTDDGITWTDANVTGSSLNPNYNNIVYGNGIFIMTSTSSPYPTYSSTGGAVWTGTGSPGLTNGLAYGNGIWVAVQGNSVSTATVKFSTNNGSNWNNGTIANLGWNKIVYADPYFITSAELSTTIGYSIDGNNWSYANTASNGGYIGYNPNGKLLVTSASAPGGGNSIISITMPTALYVDSSNGSGTNLQAVNNGSYKNLGGGFGNVGAMWQRIT